MDLSVIIVSYNVRYFLEQCLHALIRSSGQTKTEIIVVDNCSVDGSCQMVREKFPGVLLIENRENAGFARASNQGIRIACGRYILLLNPDTVIGEDTIRKCLDYMDTHPETGSLGVKMIDGNGKYLPESKRALPTPEVAFYKIFGLSALFPRSRRFGRYHLGHLDRDAIHQVDVLSGAFMFIRHEALQKTGLLDEDFFMYGEDIDLSLRMTQNGYVNCYYPETTIIHYKGESTRKSSINYVMLFYRAMIIFARKHFTRPALRHFIVLIHIAIYFRAGISILQRFVLSVINPLTSAICIYAGYAFFMPVWARHQFGPGGSYPEVFIRFIVPSYVLVWILSVYIAGGFERSVRLKELAKGVLSGTVVILLAYALLPEHLRFSRALILIGAPYVLCVLLTVRILLTLTAGRHFRMAFSVKRKKFMIVGGPDECERVVRMLDQADLPYELGGFVGREDHEAAMPGYIGHIGQISEIASVNPVDEIIFCAADLQAMRIIKTMLMFSGSDIEFRIAPPEGMSVIGSHSFSKGGNIFDLRYNALSEKANRRKKRLFDITVSSLMLVASPVLIFLVKSPPAFFGNLFSTLFGVSTWVGIGTAVEENRQKPGLKPAILTPADGASVQGLASGTAEEINMMYAKDYNICNDMWIILHNVRKLDRKKA